MKELNAIEVKTQTEIIDTFKILTNNTERLLAQITSLSNTNTQQFQQTPVILEIENKNFQANELAILVEMLAQNNIIAVGLRTQKQELIDFAKFSGLALFNKTPASANSTKPIKKIAQNQTNEALNSPKNKAYRVPQIEANKVRSSAQILAKGRDLVLLNSVKTDAEVMADGSISAYKEVSGKVFAGIAGDEKATIFMQSFNPQLVCIAGVYKKFDAIPVQLYARPVMVRLVNGKLSFQIVNPLH